MAEISSVHWPSARSRLKVSRPDKPASTRIRVVLEATSVQFPRLPLASTDTDTPMAASLRLSAVETAAVFCRPVPLMERTPVSRAVYLAAPSSAPSILQPDVRPRRSGSPCGQIRFLFPNLARQVRTSRWNRHPEASHRFARPARCAGSAQVRHVDP